MMIDDEADWSDLPFDILSEITEKVTSSSLEDQVRFGCICVQWRSFFLENHEQIKLSTLPVLLIPSFNHHHHTSTRSLYSLSEKKVYDFQLQVPSNLLCRGSSHGWLLLVEECPDHIFPVHLFNPFRSSSSNKKNKIQLPPLTSPHPICIPVRSDFIKKVVFSTDPLSSSLLLSNPTTTNIDDGDFLVLGLSADDGELRFCRPGDRAWSMLPFLTQEFLDVICYKGQFWGILRNGTALAFVITPEPNFTLVVNRPPEDYSTSPVHRYLVESAGDLFNVWRDYLYMEEDDNYLTMGFHVFKLDQTEKKWVKTNTLEGRMFFLGNNASISLSPSDYFPESCKPNSIYYTEESQEHYQFSPWDGSEDSGVFNVEDGSLESYYKTESRPIMPAPIWIQPML